MSMTYIITFLLERGGSQQVTIPSILNNLMLSLDLKKIFNPTWEIVARMCLLKKAPHEVVAAPVSAKN